MKLLVPLLMLSGALYGENTDLINKLLSHGNTAYPYSEEAKQIINGMSHEEKVACAGTLFTKMQQQEETRTILSLDPHDRRTADLNRLPFLEQQHQEHLKYLDGNEASRVWALRYFSLSTKAKEDAEKLIERGSSTQKKLTLQYMIFDVRDRETENKNAAEVQKRKAIEAKIAEEAAALRVNVK